MTLPDLLIRQKPCAMLVLLKDSTQQWYPSKLAKEAKSTYVHATKTLSKFEKAGLVSFETKGRTKTVSLTEKGVLVASLLDDLTKKLSEAPAPQPAAQPEEAKPPTDRAIV